MSLQAVTVMDAVVVRDIRPSGESAWRYHPQTREWSHSPDHKGPWVSITQGDVPGAVERLVCAHLQFAQ